MFEDFDCFWGADVFFFVGASDVAEGSLVDGRSKVSEGNFALGVGVRRVAEQARFLRQGVLGGVLGMVLHLNGLRGIGQYRSGLPEGSGGAEKTKERESDDSGLHIS